MKLFNNLKTAIIFGLGGLLIFNITKTTLEILKKGERLTNLEKEVEQMRQQKARLEQKVAAADDPAFIEKEARDRLKMIKPGEKIVVIPDQPEVAGVETANSTQPLEPNWKQWLELII